MKQNTPQIAYRVEEIRTTKFVFTEMETTAIDELFSKEEGSKLDLGARVDIDDKNKRVSFSIHSKILKDSQIIIEHIGKTTFLIQGLELMKAEKEGVYDFPDVLLSQLYALSYSHARALLGMEMSRTNFKDKFYLPVIDPMMLVNNTGK